MDIKHIIEKCEFVDNLPSSTDVLDIERRELQRVVKAVNRLLRTSKYEYSDYRFVFELEKLLKLYANNLHDYSVQWKKLCTEEEFENEQSCNYYTGTKSAVTKLKRIYVGMSAEMELYKGSPNN